MKIKVFSILTGVIILHSVVLTGLGFIGGCKSTPVLGLRPFIPAPPPQDYAVEEDKIGGAEETIPKMTITQTINRPAPSPFKLDISPERITYTVKKNDSFWKIAREHGVTMRGLAAYNNIPLNKILRIGQKLNIPPGGYVVKNLKKITRLPKAAKPAWRVQVKPQPRPLDGVYTVKSGDSFWKIARKYNLKTGTLLDANNMTGKEILQIGQKLIIPDGKKSVSAINAPDTNNPALENTSVKSILDTVDNPDDGKIDSTLKDAEKLVNDDNIDDSDDSDRAVQVIKDIKVGDFAKQYKVTPAMLKKLNADYPADGVFKSGSVVIIRSAE